MTALFLAAVLALAVALDSLSLLGSLLWAMLGGVGAREGIRVNEWQASA